MTTFKNIHLRKDKQPYGDSYLMLDATSCWKASRASYEVIEALSKRGTREQYIGELRELGSERAEEIFEHLCRKGILREEISAAHRILSFLKSPAVPVLKGIWIKRLFSGVLLKALFSPGLIWTTFALFGASLAWLYGAPHFTHGPSSAFTWNSLSLLWIGIGALAHELGHSSACGYTGIGFRTIGLTWYFIWPVAFTNVSGIDLLRSRERLLINISGGYFQCGVIVVLTAMDHLWPASGAGGAVRALNYLLIINLNPFIRSDAYWCMKDGVLGHPLFKESRILKAVYHAGYAAFTLMIVYFVSMSTYAFVLKAHNNWQGLESLRLGQIVYFLVLTYVQFLILKGIALRMISLPARFNVIEKKIEADRV